MYYLISRYYDPNTGRFLSKDTDPGQLNNPQTNHPYIYVGNNPINFIDPDGHSWKKFLWKAADAYFGISDMVKDFKTLTNGNASVWDRVKAGGSLLFNVASNLPGGQALKVLKVAKIAFKAGGAAFKVAKTVKVMKYGAGAMKFVSRGSKAKTLLRMTKKTVNLRKPSVRSGLKKFGGFLKSNGFKAKAPGIKSLRSVKSNALNFFGKTGKVRTFAKNYTRELTNPALGIKYRSPLERTISKSKGLNNNKALQDMRTLRKWAKSKGWKKQYTEGGVEMWGVTKPDNKFSWRLKLKPQVSTRKGLGPSSRKPRFDARLEEEKYINPFTGEIGGKKVGKHIPLGGNLE